MIAQAVLPHLEVWQVQGRAIKIANPARRPLCPGTPWRNKQCRSTCYELTPSHVSSLQGPRLWGKRLALCSAVVGCLEGPVRVKTGKAQCEQMFSAVHPTTDIAKILRHVRFVPLPDSCIAAIASYSITSSALTSSAGDVIRHRRRLFFPRALVEHAQHGERHGLNPGLDGRLRHRREQGRVVARQLRTFALAGGSDALRLVDADTEEHRGHASVDE